MRCTSVSSCSMRCAATLISLVVLSAMAGRLVLARRSSSVLPPPSRFACASASAFTGLCADLLLTSTTSIGALKFSNRRPSGGTNFTSNSAAWTTSESAIATGRIWLPAEGGARSSKLSDADEMAFADTGAEEAKHAIDCMRSPSTRSRGRWQASWSTLPTNRQSHSSVSRSMAANSTSTTVPAGSSGSEGVRTNRGMRSMRTRLSRTTTARVRCICSWTIQRRHQ